MDSLKTVKANVLTQQVLQRVRAWEGQTRDMHVACSCLICSRKLESVIHDHCNEINTSKEQVIQVQCTEGKGRIIC